ncbi:GDSL esterase/lipase At1g28600 [Brachypodium distachyon]|uniref:GDSL esterase/lipase n=1 Tax=Brachypodium distachyon TaxID=15368 RepID=A0A0Q3GWK0_BRADI|nr:GDSL esterase/lipase At1g28600 [Brachypodium distachyon]KQK15391.1 hypothetical protein BRADI_1g22460v3 [Brachypodium distachyon]|eukprot:XP_003560003.3 GDSL esterase/lipase At1g28600 [Brachypodium distachyon]
MSTVPFPSRLCGGLLVVMVALLLPVHSAAGKSSYTGVLSFGDSLADTGNALAHTGGGVGSQLPYGETFFGHPTGRASDGRIVLDFIVEELGMEYPTPYFAGKTAADFQHGVNFAYGGATALDPEFLRSRGLTPFVLLSLANQTAWFRQVLHLVRSVHAQRELMARSLVMVGEMGINDYLVAFFAKRTPSEVEPLVPHVIQAVRSLVNEVISAGAKTVVVRGMIPLGCQPQMLALFENTAGAEYNGKTGCLTRLNELARIHNRKLFRMVLELRLANLGRGVDIFYADQYGPVDSIVRTPRRYGFGEKPLVACCGGGGGKYNFGFSTFCGVEGATLCSDPSKYVSWDGIHMTDTANGRVAAAVLRSTGILRPKSLGVASA